MTEQKTLESLEVEIERRGLQEQYATALLAEVDPDGAQIFSSAIEIDQYTSPHDSGWKVVLAIARATPAQRRDAALKATGNL